MKTSKQLSFNLWVKKYLAVIIGLGVLFVIFAVPFSYDYYRKEKVRIEQRYQVKQLPLLFKEFRNERFPEVDNFIFTYYKDCDTAGLVIVLNPGYKPDSIMTYVREKFDNHWDKYQVNFMYRNWHGEFPLKNPKLD